ncbi:nuclear transport factor 2 family protein [Pedobacter frigoris]|uniref:Nuclear transport factor 2 family protein n=1 Tax=Pedobacter frigoris TaxID=2571272 RepID=A0A4V5NZI6_9SPHI|nr:nuclear transport factor 2 family protein [Pedobacter frigoris]TKC07448.1 nuclear transport factor 2 family protein [Pedobacter frigoris]
MEQWNMQAEEELIEFGKLWDKAIVNNDVLEIAKFMSEDWVITGSDGITSKSSFLELIESGVLTHNRMDADESDIRIYGQTGVVISRGTSAGTYKGQPFEFYEWSTSIFIWKQGKWLCVSTMVTPAKK